MSLREKINQNPRVGMMIAGIGVFIAIVCLWVFWPRSVATAPSSIAGGKVYFTDDDGKTYFPDAWEKLATTFNGPGGKEAVRAHVYQYGKETPFVGWMERYTPAGKKLLADHYSDPATRGTPPPEMADLQRERLVKKPGAANWTHVGQNPTAYYDIIAIPNKGEVMPTYLTAN